MTSRPIWLADKFVTSYEFCLLICLFPAFRSTFVPFIQGLSRLQAEEKSIHNNKVLNV